MTLPVLERLLRTSGKGDAVGMSELQDEAKTAPSGPIPISTSLGGPASSAKQQVKPQ
jgi:hypothetical protein